MYVLLLMIILYYKCWIVSYSVVNVVLRLWVMFSCFLKA
jgi:hypothetical protein